MSVEYVFAAIANTEKDKGMHSKQRLKPQTNLRIKVLTQLSAGGHVICYSFLFCPKLMNKHGKMNKKF